MTLMQNIERLCLYQSAVHRARDVHVIYYEMRNSLGDENKNRSKMKKNVDKCKETENCRIIFG